MDNMGLFAKMLIVMGIIILLTGLILLFVNRFPSFPYRLPGDILIRKKNFVFYFPLGLSILLSILLSIFLRLFK